MTTVALDSRIYLSTLCNDKTANRNPSWDNFQKARNIVINGTHYLNIMEKSIAELIKNEIWNTMTREDFLEYKKQISILKDSLTCLNKRQSFIIFSYMFSQHIKKIEKLIEDLEGIIENFEIRNSEFLSSFYKVIQTNNYQYCS